MNSKLENLIDLYNTYQNSHKAYIESVTESTGKSYSQYYFDKSRFERALLDLAPEVMRMIESQQVKK